MTILDGIALTVIIGCVFYACISFHTWCDEYFADE